LRRDRSQLAFKQGRPSCPTIAPSPFLFTLTTTLHKGKGLEFDHVFLPAWEAGLFPADYSDMGEERRLAYVALTRGRQRVTVSYCAFRRGFTKPSVFIEDLPAENVVHGWLHVPQEASNAPGDTAGRQTRGSRR